MMENFYKITKAEAVLLGKFEYETNQLFDPFCGEQVDGSFLISESTYLLLKNTKEFKQIDFDSKILIPKNQLNTKPVVI